MDSSLPASSQAAWTGHQNVLSSPGSTGAMSSFHVDVSKIQSVPSTEQQSELQQLGLTVFNQQEFEDGVLAQVDEALNRKEEQRAHKLLSKELNDLKCTLRNKQKEFEECRRRLESIQSKPFITNTEALKLLKTKTQTLKDELSRIRARDKWLREKLSGPASALPQALLEGTEEFSNEQNVAATVVSQNKLVEQGEMTPFGTMVHKEKSHKEPPDGGPTELTAFEQYLQDQSKKNGSSHHKTKPKRKHSGDLVSSGTKTKSVNESPHTIKKKKSVDDSSLSNFTRSGPDGKNFFDRISKRTYQYEADFSRYEGRKKSRPYLYHNFTEDGELSDIEIGDEIDEDEKIVEGDSADEWRPEMEGDLEVEKPAMSMSKKSKQIKKSTKSQSKAGESSDSEEEDDLGTIKQRFGVRKSRVNNYPSSSGSKHLARDDGTEKAYRKRLLLYEKERAARAGQSSDSGSDMECDGGFRVPGKIWNKLYRYQKTGVRWMWELHCQHAGGILGDEMGLGKTIQLISFLAGLEYSQLSDREGSHRGLGPSLVVCPTTVLHQWVREFHKWWPQRRVAILHNSGSYTSSESGLVHSIVRSRGILITAFSSVLIHQDLLIPQPWHYVVLDEGHKIRNPNAQITIACKQFKTSHRLILSGSPVQNNLKELWSLFDFIFPGKLGTLPDFMQHFSVPIVQGGYSNATQVAVQTAYKCACVLRDTINPYLLRRMKADVKNSLQLPSKNEQVLFCRLTPHQKEVYKEYLDSKECGMILSGNFMVFPGLITLRKICNHPDLSTGGPNLFDVPEEVAEDEEAKAEWEMSRQFGYFRRSGKLIVVQSLLKLWHQQGHRVLLFTQSRQMLDILQQFVESENYTYRRMDGATPISARQPLINTYNEDQSIFLFLLTTRVGGLGVNLTGANRVVIYDPDWNPSTDTQARERAWRIGQRRDVTVYRLLTTGTIEEKIYHRQIFKQFLTNRVLKDPKQRRFFKSNDLYELFTLGDDNPHDGTETSAIFAGIGSDVRVKVKLKGQGRSEGQPKRPNRFDLMKEKEKEIEKDERNVSSEKDERNEDTSKRKKIKEEDGEESSSEDEKLSRMKMLAKKLSQQIGGLGIAASCQKTVVSNGQRSEKSGATDQSLKHRDEKHDKNAEKEKKPHKRSRKSKKHKRRHKDANLEGQAISYLDSHSTYKQAATDESEGSSKHQDDYVLQKLLKKTGVHSALQHDVIMQSAQPDFALVEAEAERVAKEAARALKASRSQCLQAGGAARGVPTWTGSEGVAGAPGARPRFGQKKRPGLVAVATVTQSTSIKGPDANREEDAVKEKHFDGTSLLGSTSSRRLGDQPGTISSAELLGRMRQRNLSILGSNAQSDHEGDGEDELFAVHRPIVQPDPNSLEMLTDLRNFMAIGSAVNGMATTEELLQEFTSKIGPQDSAKFKAMLNQIATLHKFNNKGMWKLKPEFR